MCIFTESATWADSVIESRCPYVCIYVCMFPVKKTSPPIGVSRMRDFSFSIQVNIQNSRLLEVSQQVLSSFFSFFHVYWTAYHCFLLPSLHHNGPETIIQDQRRRFLMMTWASPASFQFRISFISLAFRPGRFFGILSWISLEKRTSMSIVDGDR